MRQFTVMHFFCGLGGAALGFQQAAGEYRGMVGRFRTLGGIDCDPESCADFETLTGVPATQMDLFTRDDYEAFHGHSPGSDWREATPNDVLVASGGEYPDVVFLSPPCKGFSGLLPSNKAASEKYQALNRLVVRGLQLMLDAYADNLPAAIMLENVPRITTRGEWLLRQVKRLLGRYGYLFHEGYHDCGELGGLGQRRKRYLLIARHKDKLPQFIYRPETKRVKTIGEIIGPLPLPDDPVAGPMHCLPRLQWKTWVRLALIPAGGDWRDLPKGNQYGIAYEPRKGAFTIADWDEPLNTVIGSASVGGSNGVAAVADPRLSDRDSRHPGVYKVHKWDESSGCITGTRFGSGALAIGDPRFVMSQNAHQNILQVNDWGEPAKTVTGSSRPTSGAISIADPRLNDRKNRRNNSYMVRPWDGQANTITGEDTLGSGAQSIADPRLGCQCRSGSYGVQSWNEPGKTITGAGDIHSGSAAIADPRIPNDNERPDPPPVIIALDGTRHRPLTTLELAALQGFSLILRDGKPLVLAGKSDARWRERIGNAVPPLAARAIGEEILIALLAAECGAQELRLSTAGIWVQEINSSEAWLIEGEA